jgi:hypothetical protein
MVLQKEYAPAIYGVAFRSCRFRAPLDVFRVVNPQVRRRRLDPESAIPACLYLRLAGKVKASLAQFYIKRQLHVHGLNAYIFNEINDVLWHIRIQSLVAAVDENFMSISKIVLVRSTTSQLHSPTHTLTTRQLVIQYMFRG